MSKIITQQELMQLYSSTFTLQIDSVDNYKKCVTREFLESTHLTTIEGTEESNKLIENDNIKIKYDIIGTMTISSPSTVYMNGSTVYEYTKGAIDFSRSDFDITYLPQQQHNVVSILQNQNLQLTLTISGSNNNILGRSIEFLYSSGFSEPIQMMYKNGANPSQLTGYMAHTTGSNFYTFSSNVARFTNTGSTFNVIVTFQCSQWKRENEGNYFLVIDKEQDHFVYFGFTVSIS